MDVLGLTLEDATGTLTRHGTLLLKWQSYWCGIGSSMLLPETMFHSFRVSLQLLLMLVDAAYSGDWSRIGVITKGM